MNLIIDIGNTFTKISLFERGKEIYFEKFESSLEKYIQNVLSKFPGIQNVILSSVSDDPVISYIKSILNNVLILNENTSLPISIDYDTPETLGKDRIGAVVGANTLFPHKNVLIIDAGTAITFDFINKNGVFEGGNISPGLNTRFKALHHFTSKLPLVSPDKYHSIKGKSTQEAISGGVCFGMIYEILGYIKDYQNHYEELKVILTGGDANYFMEKLNNSIFNSSDTKYFVKTLKNSIFVVLNLNMIGLNRILEYNVKKN